MSPDDPDADRVETNDDRAPSGSDDAIDAEGGSAPGVSGNRSAVTSRPDDGWIDSRVPRGADTADCPYCGRPFGRERHRDLHRGQAHPEQVTDREIDAYHAAAESEWEELRRFRLLALAALVVLYFGFLIAFAASA